MSIEWSGIVISLLSLIITKIDQIFHVEYPQVSMGGIDGTIELNIPYGFSLMNIRDLLWIIRVEDKNKVLNPNARDFIQLPVEWSKDTLKYFSLRDDLKGVPDDLNIILYLQDVRHRYFKLSILKEQGIIKTDVHRTLKCVILHNKA